MNTTFLNMVDDTYCSGCGSCVSICPMEQLELVAVESQKKAAFVPNPIGSCIKCGQCMAVCPKEAVHVEPFTYERDFQPLPETSPSPEPLLHLMQHRRTIRQFKDTLVPKSMVENILEMASSAPMSFPPHKVSITLVAQKELLEEITTQMHQFYVYMNQRIKSPIVRFFMRQRLTEEEYRTVFDHLEPILPVMLERYLDHSMNKYLYDAPLLMLLHAPKTSSGYTNDSYVVTSYILLAAQSFGLGSIVLGIVPPAFNRGKTLKPLAQIPEDHVITVGIGLGYPKYKFKRSIKRSFPSIQWIEK